MPVCSICSINFTLNKNLYQHMRKKHQIIPELPGTLDCALNCQVKFRNHKELRSHLETFHELVLEVETQDFPDFETFETWKKEFEGTSGYGYIRRNTTKPSQKQGDLKYYFICHRSGIPKSVSVRQSKVNKSKSIKIGRTCPSIMEVSKSLIDGRVKLTFYKTHIGHEANVLDSSVRKANYSRKSEMINFNVCAVIPAAGIGERTGLHAPKQYIPIHQKPLICYTVESFLRMSFIKKVVVVAAPESVDLMLQTVSQTCALEGEKLVVTEGSGSRHCSIKSGLTALQTCSSIEPDVVVIHDGVRPFVSIDTSVDVIKAAEKYGAAGVVCPLVSTVISVDEKGFLDHALDRSKFRASEMPQAFQYDVICKAYEECSSDDLEHGTECLQLVHKYAGVRAKLLPGNSHLWKVTHRKDIYACAAVVKENQPVAIVDKKCASALLPLFKVNFCKTFKSVHVIEKFETSLLNKFPNIVQIDSDTNPYNTLDQLNILTSGQKLAQLCAIVHIIRDFDPTVNFLTFQKQAKMNAHKLKPFNVLVYFILRNENECINSHEEVAELARSLLFDSNPNISGSVFLT